MGGGCDPRTNPKSDTFYILDTWLCNELTRATTVKCRCFPGRIQIMVVCTTTVTAFPSSQSQLYNRVAVIRSCVVAEFTRPCISTTNNTAADDMMRKITPRPAGMVGCPTTPTHEQKAASAKVVSILSRWKEAVAFLPHTAVYPAPKPFASSVLCLGPRGDRASSIVGERIGRRLPLFPLLCINNNK